jgi:hypothetical protein
VKQLLKCLAFLPFFVSGAQAAQLTLGDSISGQYDVTGQPPASLLISGLTISGIGTAFIGGDSGNYTFGPMAPATAGPLTGGNFPFAGTQPFSVAMIDGDTLAGTVGWTLLKDDSFFPHLIGTLAIATTSGDADWSASFAPGGSASIDITLNDELHLDVPLSVLATTNFTLELPISVGEVIPTVVGVREPTGYSLLVVSGFGFVLTALMARKIGWPS